MFPHPGGWGGGGGTPYMDYIGMGSPRGYGFSAILVIDRVSILADFDHFGINTVEYGFCTLTFLRVCV